LYLRHSVRRKNGRSHTYWRLVGSVRGGGKVVQETVAQFGGTGCRRPRECVGCWRTRLRAQTKAALRSEGFKCSEHKGA
jgi:hypothetical protein